MRVTSFYCTLYPPRLMCNRCTGVPSLGSSPASHTLWARGQPSGLRTLQSVPCIAHLTSSLAFLLILGSPQQYGCHAHGFQCLFASPKRFASPGCCRHPLRQPFVEDTHGRWPHQAEAMADCTAGRSRMHCGSRDHHIPSFIGSPPLLTAYLLGYAVFASDNLTEGLQ